MKGKLVSTVLTSKATLDFDVMSAGRGIRNLSIHNVGKSVLVIDDATGERVYPGESWLVESPVNLINTDFSLLFIEEEGKANKAIIRYIVEVDC